MKSECMNYKQTQSEKIINILGGKRPFKSIISIK